MQSTRKFLSWTLAVIMIISIIPTTALAENVTVDNAVAQITDQDDSSYYQYESLEAALEAAEDGAVVELLADTSIDESLTISKGVTIQGNGKTITANGLSPAVNISTGAAVAVSGLTIDGAARGFDLLNAAADLTLTGCTLNVSQRGITCSLTSYDGMKLTLDGTKINNSLVSDYETAAVYDQHSRGISLWGTKNSAITLTNGSEINGFSYCINVSGEQSESGVADTSGMTVTVENSTLRGWTGFNVWGSEAVYNLIGSRVLGVNTAAGSSNNFSAITFNDDIYDQFADAHAENNVLNITDSTITNYQNGPCVENLLRIDCGITKLNLSGTVRFIDTTGNISSALYLANMADPAAFLKEGVSIAEGAVVTCTAADGTELPFAPVCTAWYYWDDGNGGYQGVYCDLQDIFTSSDYTLCSGEYIDLVADAVLDGDVTVALAEGSGSFTLHLQGYAVTGGKFILPAGVSAICDREAGGLFAAATGYKIGETVDAGKYTYSPVALSGSTAATIGTTEYTDLAAAIQAAGDGDTVVLQKAYDGEQIIIDKAISVDVREFTASAEKLAAGADYTRTVNGTVYTFVEKPAVSAGITRAQLAEMVYANEKLQMLIKMAAGENDAEPSFTDIGSCTDAQKEAITNLCKARILSGTAAETFTPDAAVTRAEAAVVIWRAAGSLSNKEPANIPYTDVVETLWYSAAVNCLYAMGVLSADDAVGGKFEPYGAAAAETVDKWLAAYDSLDAGEISGKTVGGGVSRAEMTVVFYENFKDVLSQSAKKNTDMPFTDIAGCTDEQKEAITFFYQLGIISGTAPTTFTPYAAASNAQVAVFLQRIATAQAAVAQNAVEQSSAESTVMQSAMVRYAERSNAAWYANAVAFLVEQGVLTAEQADDANFNPHAPGITAKLESWNEDLRPNAPAFSPAAGTYTSAQSVAISAEDGAAVYYTTDGTDPTTASTVYSGPVAVSKTSTIKAIAVKNNLISGVAAATYTIKSGSTGGSSSGGGSSSSGTTKTETTKNPDGSTTTTVTDTRTGTVTETVKTADGVTGTTVTGKDGDVTKITASIPADVAKDAAASGEAVTLPVEAPAVKDADDAAAISVTVPRSAGAVKVEIPVEKVTPGTVAVIVNADGTEEIVKTSVTTENGVALTLEGSATVKVIDNSKEFVDVHPVDHWAEASIDFVTSRELFNGKTADTFAPNDSTTRAQLMTVLARLDGADTSGAALEKGMAWAVREGISDGTNPSGTITRQQLAAMLYRYAGSPATADYELTHSDAHKVSDYAVDAMRWAVANGIITGKADGTLDPHGLATRAQVAAMMARFCAKIG